MRRTKARHDQVLLLVKAGKAHLDAVICGASQSGAQTTIEEIDDTPYAIDFLFGLGPEKSVYADDFKRRNLGRRVVFKGQTTADHRFYDGSVFLENTTLDGFVNVSADDRPIASPTAQPKFSTQRVNTKPPYFFFDQIRFLGTYSPMPKDSWPQKAPVSGDKITESEMTLVFAKATQVQLDPGALKDVKPSQLELELSLYSMDRDKALQILNQKQEMDSAYQAVQPLLKAGQAKLEHMTVLRTISGIKSNIDEATEFIYSSSALGELTTQDIGFSEEMKPFFAGASPFLTIDISQCQLLNYVGNLHVEGVSAPYNETQPVFGLQSIVTAINSALGEHELLGTISPPGNTGVNDQKDTGRVWLAFLKTTAVNP
jgi:hypothetical protein